jgi:hypothetical protein
VLPPTWGTNPDIYEPKEIEATTFISVGKEAGVTPKKNKYLK